jgi:DNA-binding MarR family transcriptional regulator
MGELASALDVGLSTMTGVIDQLEEKGLVERVDHPGDRRKGHQVYQRAHEAFLSHLSPLFERRPAVVRRQILEFLEDVVSIVEGWRENPRKLRLSSARGPRAAAIS